MQQNNSFTDRPISLPAYVDPPTIPQNSQTLSNIDSRRASESGSESEHSVGSNRKDRDYKRSSVLSNLFGRRKKPQS